MHLGYMNDEYQHKSTKPKEVMKELIQLIISSIYGFILKRRDIFQFLFLV